MEVGDFSTENRLKNYLPFRFNGFPPESRYELYVIRYSRTISPRCISHLQIAHGYRFPDRIGHQVEERHAWEKEHLDFFNIGYILCLGS